MSEKPRRPLRGFGDSLPMALLRARESVMRHFRPMLHHFGLTEQQWRVLRALTATGESEVTRLAHATCLLGPSLSRILKDLEARDLVTRRPSPSDLRLGLMSISPAGSALVERIGIESERIYGEIASRCGEPDLAELMSRLARIEQTLGESSLATWEDDSGTPARPRVRRGRPPRPGAQRSKAGASTSSSREA